MGTTPRNTGRRRTRKTSDAVEIIDAMLGNDPGVREQADQPTRTLSSGSSSTALASPLVLLRSSLPISSEPTRA